MPFIALSISSPICTDNAFNDPGLLNCNTATRSSSGLGLHLISDEEDEVDKGLEKLLLHTVALTLQLFNLCLRNMPPSCMVFSQFSHAMAKPCKNLVDCVYNSEYREIGRGGTFLCLV
jgi:hypothetical protein